MSKPNLSHLAEKWNSSVITRNKIEEWTGGLISAGYLANLDAAGMGPPGRFRSGRKVCYEIGPFIKWLENRSEVI